MFKFLAIPVILSLFIISCKRDKNDIDAPDPIKQLISQRVDCRCQPYANEYVWRGQTVYLFSCRGPACDCMTIYYNEKGERVTMDQGYMPDHFRQEARFIKEVWRCD